MPERATVTVRAAAQALDVHENTIRNLIKSGMLEAHQLPSGFKRPYADAVAALVAEPPTRTPITADMLLAEADRLERHAVRLRRAAGVLGDA